MQNMLVSALHKEICNSLSLYFI